MTELTRKCSEADSKMVFGQLAMIKLNALVALSDHLGMNAKATDAELEDRWSLYGHWLPPLLVRLINPKTSVCSRGAVTRLLDYIAPEWRVILGERVLGFAVDRRSAEVRAWRKAVLNRDRLHCRHCGAKAKLHAHHILPWALYPADRLSVDNGLTLCETCHFAVHNGNWRSMPAAI